MHRYDAEGRWGHYDAQYVVYKAAAMESTPSDCIWMVPGTYNGD